MNAPRRPRRLGLVTSGFAVSDEDWSIPALVDLVRALAREDDVRLFALRHPSRRPPYRTAGAEVFALGAADGGAALSGAPRAIATIVAEHRRRPFDLLHAFFAGEPAAVAVTAATLLGIPVVVSILGGELEIHPSLGYGGALGRVTRWLAPLALGRADAVTIGSEHVRRSLPPSLDAARWQVAPLGVATDRFFPAPAPPLSGDPAILSVGALVPVKDHAGLFDAVGRLRGDFPRVRLHLVGEGALRAELAARADRLGLGDAIAFHGAVPHGALPDFYRGAHLAVVSSRFESQSMAALEGAACGTPIVGTAVGLLPDLLGNDAVPPGRPDLLATRIARRLSDRDRLAADAGALARRVATEFGVEAAVTRFREVQDGAIERRRPAAEQPGDA